MNEVNGDILTNFEFDLLVCSGLSFFSDLYALSGLSNLSVLVWCAWFASKIHLRWLLRRHKKNLTKNPNKNQNNTFKNTLQKTPLKDKLIAGAWWGDF